jgi:hypothetical protein
MAGSGSAAFGARACDAAPTRRWLRRRLTGGLAAVVLGVALVVAGVLVRATTGRPQELTASRREAMARVVEVTRQNNGKLGTTVELTLQYRTVDGHQQTSRLGVGVPRAEYVKGVELPVVYEARHPEQALLEGVPVNPPIPWPVPIGLGVVGLVVGALVAVRTRLILRTLRDNPWVATPSSLVEATAGKSSLRPVARFLELDGAPDPEPVLAGPLSARIVPDLVDEAWVAGSDRRFVVAAPGGAPLVRTHRAKLRPQATTDRSRDRKPQPQ